MSIENNEERNAPQPGMPSGPPVVPPLGRSETLPVDHIAAATAKADWEAAKERAILADPSTLGHADRLAGDLHGLADKRTAAKAAAQEQVADTTAAAADQRVADTAGTAQASKPRKPRTTKAKDQVEAVAKSPRPRRKTASKAATTQEHEPPAAGSPPAIDGHAMPSITPEAITFLSNPDATATDLFKLRPESQAFV